MSSQENEDARPQVGCFGKKWYPIVSAWGQRDGEDTFGVDTLQGKIIGFFALLQYLLKPDILSDIKACQTHLSNRTSAQQRRCKELTEE